MAEAEHAKPGETGNLAERQLLAEFLNRPARLAGERRLTPEAAGRVEAASEEDRIGELEREVARLKDVCAPFFGEGSLTGRSWTMDWGRLLWGKDGFQLIQNEDVQDCPEIGFSTWQGNSIGKFSFRSLRRMPNGEVAVVETVLVQGKSASGRESNAGSDETGSLEGIIRIDVGDGKGSQDSNMKLLFEGSLQELLGRAPFVYRPAGTGQPGTGEEEDVHDGSDGPVGHDGPILDVNLLNRHNRYHLYVNRGIELDAAIEQGMRERGQPPSDGGIRHFRWRLISEAGRWGTLRNALDNREI